MISKWGAYWTSFRCLNLKYFVHLDTNLLSELQFVNVFCLLFCKYWSVRRNVKNQFVDNYKIHTFWLKLLWLYRSRCEQLAGVLGIQNSQESTVKRTTDLFWLTVLKRYCLRSHFVLLLFHYWGRMRVAEEGSRTYYAFQGSTPTDLSCSARFFQHHLPETVLHDRYPTLEALRYFKNPNCSYMLKILSF